MAMLQLGMPSKGYLIGTDYINFNPNINMEEEQILKILLRLASVDKKMLYVNVKEGLMKILKKPSYVDKIMHIYKMLEGLMKILKRVRFACKIKCLYVNKRRANRGSRFLNLARSTNANYFLPQTHSLGNFDQNCKHCDAIKFQNYSFKCCSNRKVSLQPLLDFPDELHRLLCEATLQAKLFRRNIRIYNNAFSFASLSANIQPPPGNGPPYFRIC